MDPYSFFILNLYIPKYFFKKMELSVFFVIN